MERCAFGPRSSSPTEGITEIVSPDRAFDQVAELRRLDPVELAAELG